MIQRSFYTRYPRVPPWEILTSDSDFQFLCMQKIEPLIPGCYYHIFNRGVNKENLFKNPGNYPYFMQRYFKYVYPVVDTLAYCLLKNHFHFLIRVKTEILIEGDSEPFEKLTTKEKCRYISTQFSHCFNSYAQALNKQNLRTGGLFQHRFKRVLVKDEQQLDQLIWYIHSNPRKHRLFQDFRNYPYSSYPQLIKEKRTWLMREITVNRFGGKEQFILFHDHMEEHAELLNKFEEVLPGVG